MNPIRAFVRPNSWRVCRRNLLAWQKYAWSSVTINIIEPLVYFLAFGYGLGAYFTYGVHGSLLQYIGPGMLGLTAVNAATFDAAWGGYERLTNNGVYESMVTAPVEPEEIAAGEYIWQAFRAVLYGAIFLGVITGLGLVHSWLALLCLPVLGLTGVLFAIPALYMAFIVKTPEHLFYYFALVATPMVMFGGVFFPLDKLPRWAFDIAWCTPLYHAVNACRALVTGTAGWSTLGETGWLVGAIVVLVWLPHAALRRKLGN
jgi:lipooligosaccharide transport system permease protein